MSEMHQPARDTALYPPLTPSSTGLRGGCPRCGEGRLFSGFLTLAPRCANCGLDYAFSDAGDGPAVFVMLIVGFIVAFLALYVEFTFQPPFWLHALLWIPLVIALALGLLRPLKGLMIAIQYKHKAEEGQLDQG
ncbi:membrane protein [Kaistia sp. 32K]|nr:membrane protein [Kaistia sp. 32K]